MNHAPGAGSTARPVDRYSSALPLYHGCPLQVTMLCVQVVSGNQCIQEDRVDSLLAMSGACSATSIYQDVCMDEMKGVLGHDSALVKLYWTGDNLDE